MADLSNVWKNTERDKIVIRSELDQEIQSAWEDLHAMGIGWTLRFSEMLCECDAEDETESIICKLAHIGLLHMFESSPY